MLKSILRLHNHNKKLESRDYYIIIILYLKYTFFNNYIKVFFYIFIIQNFILIQFKIIKIFIASLTIF